MPAFELARADRGIEDHDAPGLPPEPGEAVQETGGIGAVGATTRVSPSRSSIHVASAIVARVGV
jgi:hypothetical protein